MSGPAGRPSVDETEGSSAVADASGTGGGGGEQDLKALERYLPLLDFTVRPASRLAWAIRVVVFAAALGMLWQRTRGATQPLLSAKPGAPIPTEEIDDYRFRLPERTRRDIFADLAAAELAERARAINSNTWGGHAWSREDDRGWYERVAARAAAAKYRVALSQVYLVLDEGVRNHWPGPDGKPLPATTPPLNIRSTW